MPNYHNYIDGVWVGSSSDELFENRNPANHDDLIGLFPKSNANDVAAAADLLNRHRLEHHDFAMEPSEHVEPLGVALLVVFRGQRVRSVAQRHPGRTITSSRPEYQRAAD